MISFCFVKQKGFAFLKLLCYAQFMVIGFKKDGYISAEWIQVLYGVAVIFVFFLVLVFLLIIYTITGTYFVNRPMCTVKREGFIFYMFILLCICSFCSTILWYHYINTSYLPTLFVATFIYWISIIFVFKNMIGISLCLCN